MSGFTFNNREEMIPGVYATTKVVNQAGAIPPTFNIALIIGKGERGQPYDVTTETPLKLHDKQNEVDEYYEEGSDLSVGFEYFKKHGGLKTYLLNSSNATKGTGILQGGTSDSVIDLTAANWGDYSAGIGIEVANETTYVIITITDPDDTGVKVVSGQLTTLDACVAWINANASQYFAAVKHTDATLLPKDYDSDFAHTTSYAAGTNPDAIEADWTAILAALPTWIELYDIRLICPMIDLVTATQHSVLQSFRDLAISQRTAGHPIQIICGGIVGDTSTSASDSTSPNYRAGIYNNQDVIIAAPGMDSLAAYISSAPAVTGLLNGSPIAHNLTRDDIVASSLEASYTTSQLETLIDGGVVAIATNKNGFYLAKGVNTLQANDNTWNVAGKTTYLPTHRAVADYILRYFKDDLESFIGADGVTKNQIASRCQYNWDILYHSFDPSLFGENPDDVFGNGLPYKTDKIEAASDGQGWYVYIAFVPMNMTNYIGLYVQVVVSY